MEKDIPAGNSGQILVPTLVTPPDIYFKVVTPDFKSLGLRRNPTILHFPLGQWVHNPGALKFDASDDGGIWACRSIGEANKIRYYVRKRYDRDTLICSCTIGIVVHFKASRLKTDKVRLLEIMRR